jgi:quercetin dioxygenase-like cupin family protein
MIIWDLRQLELEPHHPRILHSVQGETRSILIELPAGEVLGEHQVHEYTHLVVVDGDLEISSGGETAHGGPGTMAVFDPGERHELRARTDARVLLILAPWPGKGHPGARF